MSEQTQYAYSATITITLPDGGDQTTATITLRPNDDIVTQNGDHKRLRDCTLGELQAYADSLEAEAWQEYQQIELGELVANDAVEIVIELPASSEAEETDSAAILEHIFLPHDEEQVSAKSATEVDAAKAGVTEVDTTEAEATEMAEKLAENAAKEETEADEEMPAQPTNEAPPVEEIPIIDKEAPQPDPDIIVAESEPVREEREASDEASPPKPPPTSGKMRILGKRRPLQHPTWTAADILINEPAFRDAQAHALSSLSREVAGMLIGPQPEKQPDGRYLVHITDCIIAKHTRMHGASVTYTPESWRYVNDKLEELYPDGDGVIVGWYHTHPGFGIFLSGMDLFIHQNFFTQIWHIALVLDPVGKQTGFFCWDREQSRVDAYEFPWPPWAKKSW